MNSFSKIESPRFIILSGNYNCQPTSALALELK
jgi:hypothetical protein